MELFFQGKITKKINYKLNPIVEVASLFHFKENDCILKENLYDVVIKLCSCLNVSDVGVLIVNDGYQIKLDDVHVVYLNSQSIVVVAESYKSWGGFWFWVNRVVLAVRICCSIQSFKIVSLKYVDVFVPVRLGLGNGHELWQQLLNPSLLGITGVDLKGASVFYSQSTCEIGLTTADYMYIRHGVVHESSIDTISYRIVTHFSTDVEVEFEELENKLRGYNIWAVQFFRWCISDQLHNAMQPEELED